MRWPGHDPNHLSYEGSAPLEHREDLVPRPALDAFADAQHTLESYAEPLVSPGAVSALENFAITDRRISARFNHYLPTPGLGRIYFSRDVDPGRAPIDPVARVRHALDSATPLTPPPDEIEAPKLYDPSADRPIRSWEIISDGWSTGVERLYDALEDNRVVRRKDGLHE